MKIKLTPADVDLVTKIGTQRFEHRVRLGLLDNHAGDRPPEQVRRDNLLGAAGELTVARLLGTDVFDDWLTNRAEFRGSRATADGDVGLAVQVKTVGNRRHNLMIPNDRSNRRHGEHVFVLVFAALPDVEIFGWTFGHEAMSPENWRDNIARPAWCVRQFDLRPFDTLPKEFVR